MKLYISIVSHGHEELIKKINFLENLSSDIEVVIKSNTPGETFFFLDGKNNIHHLNDEYYLGFGNNNNYIYNYCVSHLNMKNNDLFLVVNPDVYIEDTEIFKLRSQMIEDNVEFAAINLFKNEDYTVYDNSIRKFPILSQFVKSFLGFKNNSILDKNTIKKSTNVDWSAGSFLAFSAQRYRKLKGFDENYFMYCEDIDICYRSCKDGYPLVYYPNIKAIHLAKHENRKLFSKHLYWHISSVFRFLLTKKGLTKPSSSLVD